MKLLLPISILAVLGIGGWYILSSGKLASAPTPSKLPDQEQSIIPTNVNYSAGFAIFTNGTFRIFTASMYHNLSADVYIEASNPNIIHVKKTGITWDDFFKTLSMKLTKDCLTTGTGQTFCTKANQTLRFYLNGREDSYALEKIIKNADQLLVTYGSETEDQIQKQLQQIPTIN